MGKNPSIHNNYYGSTDTGTSDIASNYNEEALIKTWMPSGPLGCIKIETKNRY